MHRSPEASLHQQGLAATAAWPLGLLETMCPNEASPAAKSAAVSMVDDRILCPMRSVMALHMSSMLCNTESQVIERRRSCQVAIHVPWTRL